MRKPPSAALLALAFVGCASGSAHDSSLSNPDAGSDPSGSQLQAPTCGPPLHPMDPSTLPSCCTDGAAHCVPSSLLPGSVSSVLATCEGGYCVPDPFIRVGGLAPPPVCASLNGPGRCLSVCVPLVAKYQALLPQDVCADDERCAPCVNPLDNSDTGACEIGECSPDGGSSSGPPPPAACPHVGPPVIDPTTLPACGTNGDAHCVQAALVPPSLAPQLATCAGGSCVPDTFIASGGNFIPATCVSVDNAEGRCLSLSLPAVTAQSAEVPQSTCASTERCVPCYSPLDGTPTGACTLSCDPGPTQPAVLFAACCSSKGKCVPTSAIPQSLQSNLDNDSCNDGDLCVPTENLQASFTPPACSASGFLVGDYTGVCLSNCLSFGIEGIALARGNCDHDHTCAPCSNPLTGQPTGAPGCPP